MSNLGGLSARVGLDTVGLKTGRAQAEAELAKVDGALLRTEKATASLGNRLSGLGATGKLVGGILGFEIAKKAAEGIKTAIDYSIDLEATMGRVKRVFGESSDSVVKFADTADRTLGRTKDQALQTAVRFGTLGTQYGETAKQAAATSVTLTKLATDLAASKGTSTDEAQSALQTALIGRGRALRLYGIDVSAALVKEEALKEGLIKSNKDALTPAMTYQASYNLIIRQSGLANDYFAQHLGTTQEKLQVSQATMKSASEELGNALMPASKAFATVLSDDVAPALKVAGEGLAYIADHRLARDILVTGGAVALFAISVSKISKAVSSTKADLIRLFGHAEQTTAIKLEGDAAEVAATKLLALRDAEVAAAQVPPVNPVAPLAGAGGTAAATAGESAGGAGLLSRLFGRGAGAAAGARTAADVGVIAGDGIAKIPGFPIIGVGGLGKPIGPDPKTWARGPDGKILRTADGGVVIKGSTKPTATARPAPLQIDPIGRLTSEVKSTASDRVRAHSDEQQGAKNESSLIGGALGGAFDLLPSGVKGDPSAAAAKVASASDSVAAAQDRLALASERLASVRGKAKTTALGLATAEAGLVAAQRNLEKAQSGLGTAKAGAAKASAPTGLGVDDLLKRLSGQVTHTQGLAADSARLIKDGVSKPVLEQIDALEKTAPGTLDRVAASLTPALAKKLNSEYSALEQAQYDFLHAPFAIAEQKAKAANVKAIQALARAQATAYKQALKGLQGDPTLGPLFGPPTPPTNHNPLPGAPPAKHTHYNMPNATIVASDPGALAHALNNRTRLANLAGGAQ